MRSPNNMEENGVKIDVAVLQERVNQHDDFIKRLEENHLPHIYKRLSRIETKMAWYAGAIVAGLGIIQFLADYFV